MRSAVSSPERLNEAFALRFSPRVSRRARCQRRTLVARPTDRHGLTAVTSVSYGKVSDSVAMSAARAFRCNPASFARFIGDRLNAALKSS